MGNSDFHHLSRGMPAACLCFLVFLFSACTPSKSLGGKPAGSTHDVRFDKGIETMMALFLAAKGGLEQDDMPHLLQKNVLQTLQGKTAHPAVRITEEYLRRGFYIDSLFVFSLNYFPPPDSCRQGFFPSPRLAGWLEYLLREEYVDSYAHQAADFFIRTDLNQTIETYQGLYVPLVKRVSRSISQFQPAQRVQAYCSVPDRKTHFTFVLSPLAPALFGCSITLTDSTPNGKGVVVLGPEVDAFGKIRDDFRMEDSLLLTSLHEIAHFFLAEMLEKNWGEWKKREHLFESIREAEDLNRYGTWRSAVTEHLASLVAYRIYSRAGREGAARDFLFNEEKKGHCFLPFLLEVMEIYEENRDSYHTLDRFFPHLLAALDRLSPEDLKRIAKTASAAASLRRGKGAFLKGECEQALLHFERAERLDPRNPRASFEKGNALLVIGKLEKSREAFKEAYRRSLKSDPERILPWTCIRLGWVHDLLRERDAALSWYERAIALPDERDSRREAKMRIRKPLKHIFLKGGRVVE